MLKFTNGRLAITDGVTITCPNDYWIEEVWDEGIRFLSPDRKSSIEVGMCNTAALDEEIQESRNTYGDGFDGPKEVSYSGIKGIALLYKSVNIQYSVYLDIGKGDEKLEVVVHSNDLGAYIAGEEFCEFMSGIEAAD